MEVASRVMAVFIVHSERNSGTILGALGTADYSYYFVSRAFHHVLDHLGTVIDVEDGVVEASSDGKVVVVHDVRSQVDAIYEICRHVGEPCLFLSFAPPHRTPLDLECPTIPVFAWEFPDIPNESWDGEPRHDWCFVLGKTGRAITHAEFSARAVRNAMGGEFPVAVIPAPVWGRYSSVNDAIGHPPDLGARTVEIPGGMLDSRSSAPQQEGLRARATFAIDPVSADELPAQRPAVTRTPALRGVVYTAVLNPRDDRKHWQDIVRAFCSSLREHEDATLVLKLIGRMEGGYGALAALLARLRPFRCRVVATDAYLSGGLYERLARASTYAVNAARGEGQCLPLMEFMSCGTPAIAPCHTGMRDYIDETNAFLVETSLEPASWPQDSRLAYRTLAHRLNVESLMAAFRESHRVAREEPERYQAMSRSAVERLRRHCSTEHVRDELIRFFEAQLRSTGYPEFSFARFGEAWPGAERKRYSQGNEELIIRDFFADEEGGIFVDVGCAGPNARSATCYLERHLGWSGIAVDAIPDYAEAFALLRPRTTFANFMVTDHGDTGDFYRVPGSLELSSMDEAREVFGRKHPGVPTRVPATTLDDLLARQEIARIDFLSIDVEGAEPKVLAGFDIQRFKPRLVCIECAENRELIEAYFARHGYERIEEYRRYDSVNWYFCPASSGGEQRSAVTRPVPE